MSDSYGPLLRLWGTSPSQVPAATATHSDLQPFLTSLLSEALPFIQDVPIDPKIEGSAHWKSKGIKTYPSSTAPVYLFERDVAASDLRIVAKANNLPTDNIEPETWFLRRSVHVDAPEKGTATWDEFKSAFKDKHAETELAFTASILNTGLYRSWDVSGVEIEHEGETWVDWTLRYEHSVHKLPAPLKKRDFPVLQATAAAKGQRRFLTIQIAVRGIDKDVDALPGGTIHGVYTSVERVTADESGAIEWLMGTVSDARGVLPGWLQKLSVPGAVAKDVGMFLEWLPSQRKN